MNCWQDMDNKNSSPSCPWMKEEEESLCVPMGNDVLGFKSGFGSIFVEWCGNGGVFKHFAVSKLILEGKALFLGHNKKEWYTYIYITDILRDRERTAYLLTNADPRSLLWVHTSVVLVIYVTSVKVESRVAKPLICSPFRPDTSLYILVWQLRHDQRRNFESEPSVSTLSRSIFLMYHGCVLHLHERKWKCLGGHHLEI
jgi:hypothetical protein